MNMWISLPLSIHLQSKTSLMDHKRTWPNYTCCYPRHSTAWGNGDGDSGRQHGSIVSGWYYWRGLRKKSKCLKNSAYKKITNAT